MARADRLITAVADRRSVRYSYGGVKCRTAQAARLVSLERLAQRCEQRV